MRKAGEVTYGDAHGKTFSMTCCLNVLTSNIFIHQSNRGVYFLVTKIHFYDILQQQRDF